jgi:fluoroquinolone transport system ATP-binding protein
MIAASGLAFAYRGSDGSVFTGLDFRIGPGEILGITGAAGAGKTTLHKILSGVFREYAGAVSFEGKDLQDWSRDFFENIGVTFELPGLRPELTARENLAYFGRLYRGAGATAEAWLNRLGLDGQAGTRAGGLPAASLKLLDLARAMVHDPRALLLDEPLRDLDSAGAAVFKELLLGRRKAGAAAVIFTRDRASVADICDRCLLLDVGGLRSIEVPGATP